MSDPREIALKVLNRVENGRKTLDKIFEEVVDPTVISGRDRALLNALVYGVLRWRGRLDFIISFFSTTRLNKIDPVILNILRIGLFQIIYMDRIPNSAAVDTSVRLAKAVAARWVSGFVNAILRNASTKLDSVVFPDKRRDSVYALTFEKSFPDWLITRWIDRYGLNATEMLCDAINSIPPITLRTNTLKTSRSELMQCLEAEVEQLQSTALAPDGISIFNPKMPIAQFDAFKKGWFQVQDEAAQLVALLLDPRPGETILDACAGLGGKSGHIAQQMNNQGVLVAMDSDAEKLARLETQMHRLGITIVSTWHHNLNASPVKAHDETYDRILLDAPCTGLGVLRRNPDIKWNTSKKNLERFAQRQLKFLDNLAPLVKTAGVLVYVVCSVEPEETEAVINTFLANNPGYEIDRKLGKLPPEISSRVQSAAIIKTYPHYQHLDGFFMARLKRAK